MHNCLIQVQQEELYSHKLDHYHYMSHTNLHVPLKVINLRNDARDFPWMDELSNILLFKLACKYSAP